MLIIKSFFSCDCQDLENFNSPIEDLRLPIDVEVGKQDENGTNLFYFYIISPEAIKKYYFDRNVFSLKHFFLVNSYNWSEIKKEITDLILSCEEETWEKTALSLSRYFNWEYENHVEVSYEFDEDGNIIDDSN